jgi:hypothetical protein
VKRLAGLTVFLVLYGAFAASCGSGPSNPLGSGGAGSGDPGAGDGPVTSGGPVTTAGPTTGSTSTGGSCKPGGSSCQSFNECCSGTCAQQVCTQCGGQGDPCADSCCNGLTCFNGTCGTCKGPGNACTLASECCSNVCQQGTCASCTQDGNECSTNQDCCTGTCTNNICGGGDCNPSLTCNDVLMMKGASTDLCDGPLQYWTDLYDCVCQTTCADVCGMSSFCGGASAFTQACQMCLGNVDAGCNGEGNACVMH